MADLLTFEEHRGVDQGGRSPGSATATTCCPASTRPSCSSFKLNIAVPGDYQPGPRTWLAQRAPGDCVTLIDDPREAVEGADVVITDTWVSMGDTDDDERRPRWSPTRSTPLMALADKDALFLHCLPAHRGEEVTDEVIDGPQSVVWDEAENRIHAQKSILCWAFGADVN